jgi:hypothetical protein
MHATKDFKAPRWGFPLQLGLRARVQHHTSPPTVKCSPTFWLPGLEGKSEGQMMAGQSKPAGKPAIEIAPEGAAALMAAALGAALAPSLVLTLTFAGAGAAACWTLARSIRS